MIYAVKIMGIIGFFICLGIMYMPNHGIQNIKKHDSDFHLLDMQFHYDSVQMEHTMKKIGKEGRTAYRDYLILDCVFIFFFFITMVTITDGLFSNQSIKMTLIAICGLRAIFDGLENSLLFIIIKQYPDFHHNLATACSWATTFKFIMLYIWLLAVGIGLLTIGLAKIVKGDLFHI